VDGCSLNFVDPDNGLKVPSVSLSSRLASKYFTVEEVMALVGTGRQGCSTSIEAYSAILIYG
jgi:hypothetical protein